MTASIYGPPAHKRRRRRASEAATDKLTAMQVFWMVVALTVAIALLVHLDDGDPEIDDTLRQLEQMQRLNHSYRPIDPILFEIPKFEPIPMPALLELEALPAPIEPPPAEPAKKPRKKTTPRAPRPAPEQ